MSHKPFGTIIVDPPWPYQRAGSKHINASGYSSAEYKPLSIKELATLRLVDMADYLFVWTTPPFEASGVAGDLIRDWGFTAITMLYWIKADLIASGIEPAFTPSYGVGYWFRGCVEPIIVCKVSGAKSIRTSWIGMISPNGRHSRKPNTLYEIVESDFPGPYAELFARRERDNWTIFGNEAPGDGEDIRLSTEMYLAEWRTSDASNS